MLCEATTSWIGNDGASERWQIPVPVLEHDDPRSLLGDFERGLFDGRRVDEVTASGDPFEEFDEDDFDDDFDDDFEEEWDEELPGDADQFEPDEVEIDEDAEPGEPDFEDEE